MPLPYPTASEDIAPLGRQLDERSVGTDADVQAAPRTQHMVDTVTGWRCASPAVPFALRPAEQTGDPVDEYVARLRAKPKLAAATADTQILVHTGADGRQSDVESVHMLVLCAHSAALRAAVFERPAAPAASGSAPPQSQRTVDVQRHAVADRPYYTVTMPQGMPVDAVRKAIGYMYTREVSVTGSGCDSLLAVANHLRMAELLAALCDYMTQVAGHSEQWASRLAALCIKHRLPLDTADAIQHTLSRFELDSDGRSVKVEVPAAAPPPPPPPEQQEAHAAAPANEQQGGCAAGDKVDASMHQVLVAGVTAAGTPIIGGRVAQRPTAAGARPQQQGGGVELVPEAYGSEYDLTDMI